VILRRGAALLAAAIFALVCSPAAAGAAAASSGRGPVVLIAVPGLQWSDVLGMPALRGFVADAAVGELSVKTAGGVTRCAAGILAVGAGNRTAAPNGDCAIQRDSWPVLRAANAQSKYKTTIGLLGTALDRAGVTRIAVGDDAASLLADEGGGLGHQDVADSYSRALADASRAPRGAVVAALDTHLYYLIDPEPTTRAARAAQVDANLARMLAATPPDATVIVVGISDIATGRAHLHMVAIRGPGWAHTELRSSAAGRAPFVQLIDIAPTILRIENIAVPAVMVGRPMQQSGGSVPPISKYVDDDRHAFAQRTLGQRTFLTLGIATIVLMLLTLIPWRHSKAAARWLARLLAPAPALVFVMNGLPWWRWGQPVYALLVVGGSVAIAVVTTLAARRSMGAAVAVPLTASFVALVLDQLTGAHLQFSAPMGDSPIVAGRFSGVGNLDFAEIATSGLILAGVVGGWLGGRRGVLAAAGIAAVAVVVDGAPPLGNDLGGVFALVPGAIVLTVLLAGARLTLRRMSYALLATVVVAVGVALADYSRPATSQTHVGRFVGQVLHGGAWTEVHRKANASLSTFGLTVGTFVALVAILALVVAWPRALRAVEAVPGLRAGVTAAGVTAVLGVCLNDSGIPIAAMAVVVGMSAVYGAVGGRELAVAGGRTPLAPPDAAGSDADGT
jgi:hypothetical protein